MTAPPDTVAPNLCTLTARSITTVQLYLPVDLSCFLDGGDCLHFPQRLLRLLLSRLERLVRQRARWQMASTGITKLLTGQNGGRKCLQTGGSMHCSSQACISPPHCVEETTLTPPQSSTAPRGYQLLGCRDFHPFPTSTKLSRLQPPHQGPSVQSCWWKPEDAAGICDPV